MPEKLSNQTIRHILKDIHEDIKGLIEVTNKTNGRLTRLEMWRSYIAGAMAVITMLLIPVVIQYISKTVQAYLK